MGIISELKEILENNGLSPNIEGNQVKAPFGNEDRHFIFIQKNNPNTVAFVGVYCFNQNEIDILKGLNSTQQSALIKETIEYLKKFSSMFESEFNQTFQVKQILPIADIKSQIQNHLQNTNTGLQLCETKLEELLWLAIEPEDVNDIIISKNLPFFIPEVKSPFKLEIDTFQIHIDIKNSPFIPHENFIGFGRVIRPPGSKIRFLASASFPMNPGSLLKITIKKFGNAENENLNEALQLASKAINIIIQSFSYYTDTFRNEDIVNQIPLETFSKIFHLRCHEESSGYLTAVGKTYETFKEDDFQKIQNQLNQGGLEFSDQLIWESKVMFNMKNYKLAYVLLAIAIDIYIQNKLVNHPNNYQNKCRYNPDINDFELWSPDKKKFENCGFMRMIFDGIEFVSGININSLPNINKDMDILYGTRCNIVHAGNFDYKETKYHAKQEGRPNSQRNQGGIDLISEYNNIFANCQNMMKLF